MKTIVAQAILLTLGLSSVAAGQTEVPNTFQAGQPARAAEVNANFDALESAIDANATAISQIPEVGGTCSIGSFVAAINEDGSVICEPGTGEAIVLDFTDPDDCVIDEPGNYILDRSWDLGDAQSGVVCTTVEIDTNELTLDLRGHELKGAPEIPTVSQCGSGLRTGQSYFPAIHGGSVIGNPDAVDCDNEFVRLDSLYVHGSIQAHHLTVVGSEISNGSISIYGCDSDGCGPSYIANIRMLDCSEGQCVSFWSGGPARKYPNVIHNNYFEGCVESHGDNAKIIGNVFYLNGEAQCPAIAAGSGDIIGWNTLEGSGTQGTGVRVGYASQHDVVRNAVIEGNIVRGMAVGIEFMSDADGNFYGNNRVSATTPFAGTNGQTDWGGNVSF